MMDTTWYCYLLSSTFPARLHQPQLQQSLSSILAQLWLLLTSDTSFLRWKCIHLFLAMKNATHYCYWFPSTSQDSDNLSYGWLPSSFLSLLLLLLTNDTYFQRWNVSTRYSGPRGFSLESEFTLVDIDYQHSNPCIELYLSQAQSCPLSQLTTLKEQYWRCNSGSILECWIIV